MKKLIALILLITSCGAKSKIHNCNFIIKNDSKVNYTILEKKLNGNINGGKAYSADILIYTNQEEQIDTAHSIDCIYYAICKKDSLLDARFYRSIKGFEISNKYNIKVFKTQFINSTISDSLELQMFYQYAIASINVEPDEENDRNVLTSGCHPKLALRLISNTAGNSVEKKYYFKY